MIGKHPSTSRRGFSFIELLVTAAIITLVFGGLMVSVQYVLHLIGSSKISAGALALANERMEYIRSLDYNSVGTIGGIPNGPIPQTSTTSLNGVLYTERVLIQNVDSPDDGQGAGDANGILADYKQVKVEYSWFGKNGTSSTFLLTNMVPVGMESTAGGGTLIVNVFDAAVQPLSGAEVHVYNDTTTSTINTMVFSNAAGVAIFAGAPAAANYQIRVTDTGYSTDQTYSATSSNPNPATQHVAVLESAVSTMNFQIDELSDLMVRTVGPSTDGEFIDDFDTTTNLASFTDVTVSGSELLLAGGPGTYSPTGEAYATTTEPASITAWDIADFSTNIPVGTTAIVQVLEVTGTSTYTLIPDGDLPGNSTGFTTGPINLSTLDASTYPALALRATFSSSDPNVTPTIDGWSISYVITEPSIADIPFALTGAKTIGTTASASPIYKYDDSHTTDGGGEVTITGLEWDIYAFSLLTGAYDIAEACSDIPYVLAPGVSDTLTVTLVPPSARTLRVSVVDGDGDPVPGATATLSRSGFSESSETSSCGQVFFDTGLVVATDYVLDVSATGYVSENITDINIDGDEVQVVTLAEV